MRFAGYHFLVLSDGNVLSRGEKWMLVEDIAERRQTLGPPALDKYRLKFGEEWVEVRMREKGEKGRAVEEVRLKTLAEIRPKFEERNKFLLIEGEEITDREEEFFEIYNGHPEMNRMGRPGDGEVEQVPGDELIWEYRQWHSTS